MTTLFVRHPVRDYDTWKPVYDKLAPTRKSMGVTAATVHRDASNPNIVVITHRFGTVAAATKFMESSGRFKKSARSTKFKPYSPGPCTTGLSR